MPRKNKLAQSALVFIPLLVSCSSHSASDSEIKKAIIEQSIAAAPGKCPCPYHRLNNGMLCGERSDYKTDGSGTICYESDVTDAMVREHKSL